jgi:hypothetical protein
VRQLDGRIILELKNRNVPRSISAAALCLRQILESPDPATEIADW